MRAVSYSQFGGSEVLHVVDVPVPEPGPGEVRVRVTASVVHPVDLMVRSGRFPAPLPTSLPYNANRISRISRFTLTGDTLDLSSEKPIYDVVGHRRSRRQRR